MQRIPTGPAIAAACLIGVTASAQTQVDPGAREKSVRIVRTDAAPVIDGVLDEEIWSLARANASTTTIISESSSIRSSIAATATCSS